VVLLLHLHLLLLLVLVLVMCSPAARLAMTLGYHMAFVVGIRPHWSCRGWRMRLWPLGSYYASTWCCLPGGTHLADLSMSMSTVLQCRDSAA